MRGDALTGLLEWALTAHGFRRSAEAIGNAWENAAVGALVTWDAGGGVALVPAGGRLRMVAASAEVAVASAVASAGAELVDEDWEMIAADGVSGCAVVVSCERCPERVRAAAALALPSTARKAR